MKKILSLVLSAVFILTAFSACAKNEKPATDTDGATTGTAEVPNTTAPDVLPEGIEDIESWFTHATLKITGNTRAPRDEVRTTTLLAAKNESESVQLAFRSDKDIPGLSLSIKGEAEGVTPELLEVYLIPVGSTYLPDPIVPTEGNFSLVAKTTKSFLIRFKVDSDAKAGDHTYTVDLKYGNTVIDTYTVTLSVMSYALPSENFTPVYTALDRMEIRKKESITLSESRKMLEKYVYFLLDYGVNVTTLPYDVLDDRADELMSDPRITAFEIDPTLPDDKLLEIYEKLKTNSVWFDKAVFTVYDEPTTIDHLNEYMTKAKRIAELCPGINIQCAYYRNIKYDNQNDTVDIIARYSDYFCVKSCAWGEKWLADPLGKGNFADRIKDVAGEDGNIFWYVCWEPRDPYCNLQIDENALNHRTLFWQQYYYDVEGLLYWYANYWKLVSDPWTDMATVKDLSTTCYGDGSLLYPGKKVGIDGPVASIRLDCMRDGVEDIALLKLAEKELGREWVISRVTEVSSSVSVHTTSTQLFGSIRNEILTALNEKLA